MPGEPDKSTNSSILGRTSNLSIFDRDGNLIAVPLANWEKRIEPGAWSSDNRFFSFSTYTFTGTESQDFHANLLDMEEEVIYDLCLGNVNGWAWSADGSQFATILGSGQQPVVVVDIEQWQPYIVAYHSGQVLLWR